MTEDRKRIFAENFNALPENEDDVKLVERTRRKAMNEYGLMIAFILFFDIVGIYILWNLYLQGTLFQKENILLVVLLLWISVIPIFFIKDVIATKKGIGFIKKGYVLDKRSRIVVSYSSSDGRARRNRKYEIDVAFDDNTIFIRQPVSMREFEKLKIEDPITMVTFNKKIAYVALM